MKAEHLWQTNKACLCITNQDCLKYVWQKAYVIYYPAERNNLTAKTEPKGANILQSEQRMYKNLKPCWEVETGFRHNQATWALNMINYC